MTKETLIEKARRGVRSPLFRKVAASEEIDIESVMSEVARGRMVISRPGKAKGARAVGIGHGLRVKVNANIGTSHARPSLAKELKKLDVAIAAGADAVMDLSTAGNLDAIRRTVIDRSTIPVGTVPVYQAAVETLQAHPGRIDRMTADQIFGAIEKHARDGAGFLTLHCGITLESLERVRRQGRRLGVVSRGGAFLAEWMTLRGEENPLFSDYGRLLEIAARHDTILSLGDALRPGAIEDATDRGQVQELIILGELTRAAWDEGIQVMIEGPGHMTMDQIAANVVLQKKLCGEAPFYVLGPLVTDSAPGYDHITAAIGGAIAAWSGADFLCYVTPSEHLGLPEISDVREGVIAARIAAHAADLARGRPSAWDRDRRMARHRHALDWKGQEECALDPETIASYRRRGGLPEGEVCTMCGPYCSIKGMQDLLSSPPPEGEKKESCRREEGGRPQGTRARGSARKS